MKTEKAVFRAFLQENDPKWEAETKLILYLIIYLIKKNFNELVQESAWRKMIQLQFQ